MYIQTDIVDKIQVDKAVTSIEKRWGKIDVLINNASIDSPPDAPESEVGPFEEYPIDSYDKVMDVNVKGTFLCSQAVGRIMAKQKGGIIINIASQIP